MKTNIHISLTNFANKTSVLIELPTLIKYRVFDQINVMAICYPGLKGSSNLAILFLSFTSNYATFKI